MREHEGDDFSGKDSDFDRLLVVSRGHATGSHGIRTRQLRVDFKGIGSGKVHAFRIDAMGSDLERERK